MRVNRYTLLVWRVLGGIFDKKAASSATLSVVYLHYGASCLDRGLGLNFSWTSHFSPSQVDGFHCFGKLFSGIQMIEKITDRLVPNLNSFLKRHVRCRWVNDAEFVHQLPKQ